MYAEPMSSGIRASPDAPVNARTLIALVNSRRIGRRPDVLRTTALARPYLVEARLCGPEDRLTTGVLTRLVALREALDEALRDGDGQAWARIDAMAVRAGLRVAFADAATRVCPRHPGDPVSAALVALHAVLTDGTWPRIRLCAREVCAAAFYDATRSRTQRWHSYAMCGNRANVAAYRARLATGLT